MSCHQILGGGWSTAGDKQQQWWRNTDAATIFHSPTTPGKEFLPLSFTLHYTTFWCLMKSKLQFTTDLDPCMMRSMRWEPLFVLLQDWEFFDNLTKMAFLLANVAFFNLGLIADNAYGLLMESLSYREMHPEGLMYFVVLCFLGWSWWTNFHGLAKTFARQYGTYLRAHINPVLLPMLLSTWYPHIYP